MNMQADTTPAASAQVYTCPPKNTQVFTLPAVSTQAYTFPAASTRAYTFPALSTQAPSLPVVFAPPPVSTQVYTRPVMSNQPTAFPATFPYVGVSQAMSTEFPWFHPPPCKFLDCQRRLHACLHFQLVLQCLRLRLIRLTLPVRVSHSHDSVVPPYLLATGLNAAVESDNHTAVPSVVAPSQCLLPTPQPASGNLLAMIASTMEKMNADHGLPALQVVKFAGSLKTTQCFVRGFIKWWSLPTKMARLLQFLKGPALLAMQRYESVPGGLTKALLQDRFGQPFKIVRACVDTLVKGPTIALRIKEACSVMQIQLRLCTIPWKL